MKFAKLALATAALGLLAWPALAAGPGPKAPAAPTAPAATAPAAPAGASATPAPAAPAAAPAAQAAPAAAAAAPSGSTQAEAAAPAAGTAPATAGAAAAEPSKATAAPKVAEEHATPAKAGHVHRHKHEIQLGPVGYDAKGRPGHIHVVVRGDTLWDISDAYLGTPWVWPSVWHDNADIQNPHLIYPGERLWISPTDIRPISKDEADKLMKGKPAEMAVAPMPADIGAPDAIDALAKPRLTYRFSTIDRVGFVSDKELAASGSIVSSRAPQEMLDASTPVVIGFGKGEVKVGDRFDIFRTTQRVLDPVSGRPFGYATAELGWLEVTKVDAQTSLARVRESFDPIERGDHLRVHQDRSSEIAVLPRPDVEGHVVFTQAGRMEMGGGDVVFLNKGTKSGLAVGSPLEIYRPGGRAYDGVRRKHVKVLDDVVAKLLVVEANKDAAVAVVTHAKRELHSGDLFRGADSIAF